LNYIILDLEATCWKHPKGREEQEVIELGAVKLSAYGEVEEFYHSFVKPVYHPVLSHFCLDLTGITQPEVDRAPSFDRMWMDFEAWVCKDADFKLLSWGAFDEELLVQNCRNHRVDVFWKESFTDLKKQYRELNELKKPVGLMKALKREGFEFDGNHHRALDDAKNTCKIFTQYLDEWTIY